MFVCHESRKAVWSSGRSASLRMVAVGCCAIFAALAAQGGVRAGVIDMYTVTQAGVRKYFFDTDTANATLDSAFITITATTGGSTGLNNSQTALVRGDNLYVAWQDNVGEIQVYNRFTGARIERLATPPVATQMVWGPDKNGDGIEEIYVTMWSGSIGYVPTAGTGKGIVTNLVTGLGNSTYGLAISADQAHLYVGNRDGGTIRKYNTSDGSFTGQTASGLTTVGGMTLSGTNVYATNPAASPLQQPLWQVDAAALTGGTTFSTSPQTTFNGAGYVTAGPDATGDGIPDLFVGDWGNSRLVMVNRSTGATTTILSGFATRSVVFAVPEPSAGLLAFVGGVVALSFGFARKTRGRSGG